MTSIATIGAVFALGYHSYMVWWTFNAITVARRYPVTWLDYAAAFFWPVTLLAALITHPTNIDQMETDQ